MELMETLSIAWSPSGRGLAVGSMASAIVWTRAGARRIPKIGTAPIYAMAFSPSEARLALGGESKTARILDRAGKSVAKLAGDSGIVNHVSFDSKGRVLAGRAIWDEEGEVVARKRFSMMSVFIHDDLIAGAAPSYESDLASPRVTLLSTDGGLLAESPLPTPLTHVTTDGTHLAVAAGPDVVVLDTLGKELGRFRRHASGHGVSGLSIRGERIASGGHGDTSIWVTAFDGSSRLVLPGYARPTQHQGLSFAPHRSALLAALAGALGRGGGGDRVTLFDLESGMRVELLASGDRWLAVDEQGRYTGDSTLSSSALKETPELLEALFPSDATSV